MVISALSCVYSQKSQETLDLSAVCCHSATNCGDKACFEAVCELPVTSARGTEHELFGGADFYFWHNHIFRYSGGIVADTWCLCQRLNFKRMLSCNGKILPCYCAGRMYRVNCYAQVL